MPDDDHDHPQLQDPNSSDSDSDSSCDCGITGNFGFHDWDSATPQLQTVFLFIQGLRDVNFELLESTLSEDYKMEVLPRSLGIPTRAKEEWLRTCKESNILEPGYRVDIIDMNESPGRIWVHATVYARAKSGQSYENEYLLMFRLTHPASELDGKPKIKELKEFMDSLYTTNFALDVGLRKTNPSQICRIPEKQVT